MKLIRILAGGGLCWQVVEIVKGNYLGGVLMFFICLAILLLTFNFHKEQ